MEDGHLLKMPLLYLNFLLFLLAIGVGGQSSQPPTLNHGIDLPTTRPLNIAHRGNSGMLPENTIEAYKSAIAQGADVIECDVCVTKDLQLICIHDPYLNTTTDAWTKFQNKVSTRFVNATRGAATYTDVFTVDLTLAEIKTLRVKQRFPFRDPGKDFQYSIPTLQEYIDVAKSAGRPVGIYPETKHPLWVNALPIMNGTTFEDLLVAVLHKNGYMKKTDPCFIQSFEDESLKRLSAITQLPLIALVWDWTDDVSNAKLTQWAKICYGIAPWKPIIVEMKDNRIVRKTDLVERAHQHGLKVHPYTFRNENKYLAWDFGQDPYKEYEYFIQELGVDGVFTDFPTSFDFYLDLKYKKAVSSATILSLHILFIPCSIVLVSMLRI